MGEQIDRLVIDSYFGKQLDKEKFVKTGVDQQTIWWMNWQISIQKDYYKDWHVYSITESKQTGFKNCKFIKYFITYYITFDMSVKADSKLFYK